MSNPQSIGTPVDGSAQSQKAVFGETVSHQGEAQPVGSTALGVDSKRMRQAKNKPTLIKELRGVDENGKEVWNEVDFWGQIMKGLDVEKLTDVLEQAKLDLHYDMTQFIRDIEYQGFDRAFYIKHSLTKMSVSVFSRFAIIGALRGSNFAKIRDSCENMPEDLVSSFDTCGFVKTPKKRKDLTILRNTASIPHWCVYWFMKAGVTKKIPTSGCPTELQFPGAASLPMSQSVRREHLEFCYQFSQLLPGGRFNLNIYLTAMKNQIPIKEIPNEILGVLQVSSDSESYRLVDADVEKYDQTKQVVRR